MEVYEGVERLDMEASDIKGYKRWLDMREATLYRTFVWKTESGKTLNLLFKRYMNPDLRFVCTQELYITSLSACADIVIKSGGSSPSMVEICKMNDIM